jgi:S-adenosylmethionine:tRNA ribosyltransferase-isomerase
MHAYTYTLPPELLAHSAAEPRDSARLLVWDGAPEDRIFRDLPQFLAPGDVLVVNSSRVIPARLFATRNTLKVELLLHRPLQSDLTQWQALAKPRRKLKVGDTLVLAGGATATLTGLPEGYVTLTLHLPAPEIPAYLEAHGQTPLPPYIQATDSPTIRARYQNVYASAQHQGSVAAPTAGLHFTPELLATLTAQGVKRHDVVLHVGAGTFMNPTPEQIARGELHPEWAQLPAATAQAILAAQASGNKIVAVGTTALRTLETWGKLGCPPAGFSADTTLFIRPGFAFKVATHLITNFHLPGSSLLMLVAAFVGGEDTLSKLYHHAIKNRYRFYSFGDSSLLTRSRHCEE